MGEQHWLWHHQQQQQQKQQKSIDLVADRALVEVL
jgi:hypothetical protein